DLHDDAGDAVVRADRAGPLLDLDELVRALDLHAALDLDLTRQPAALAGLALADVASLGRHHGAAALEHLDLADPAAALAAAGRRDEQLVVGEGVEQGAASRHAHRQLRVAVDADGD